jgi:hypothetical protein
MILDLIIFLILIYNNFLDYFSKIFITLIRKN